MRTSLSVLLLLSLAGCALQAREHDTVYLSSRVVTSEGTLRASLDSRIAALEKEQDYETSGGNSQLVVQPAYAPKFQQRETAGTLLDSLRLQKLLLDKLEKIDERLRKLESTSPR